MKCEYDQEMILLFVTGQITGPQRMAVEEHLLSCEHCRKEAQSLREVWEKMGEIPVPEPSGELRMRFHAMLGDFREEAARTGAWKEWIGSLRRIWKAQPGLQVAYTLAFVFCGLILGYFLNRPASSVTYAEKKQMDSLSSQVHEMREMMMMSLLENPSATERIRGVSYTNEIKHINQKMVDALVSTLNSDPNANVRLMTLDALNQFSGDPYVREALVHSIVQQDSPLVQAAMADVMLKLQERKSIEAFRKLLLQKDLNKLVRTKIEQTISALT
jgi:hypothetical protein